MKNLYVVFDGRPTYHVLKNRVGPNNTLCSAATGHYDCKRKHETWGGSSVPLPYIVDEAPTNRRICQCCARRVAEGAGTVEVPS